MPDNRDRPEQTEIETVPAEEYESFERDCARLLSERQQEVTDTPPNVQTMELTRYR